MSHSTPKETQFKIRKPVERTVAAPKTTSTCPRCNGAKRVHVHQPVEGYADCLCVLPERFARVVGSEIAESETLKTSELLDAFDHDAWVTMSWSELLPHLRAALWAKWRQNIVSGQRLVHVVTDHDVLEASPAMGYERRKELDLSLAKLVIVRLGFVSEESKKKTLGGYIVEHLWKRGKDRQPTWVTDTPKNPFSDKHPACSPELQEWLARCTRIEVAA